jgi:alkylated DNA repair dioxygenase AlkB
MYLGPLPEFAIFVADKLMQRGLLAQMPDQAIVNEYVPGQGISAHVDCEPCFKDTIATVSFGWAYEMDFSNRTTAERKSVMLEPGSALVMRGDARYQWLHEIKARKSDHGIARQRRVSLTFRNMLLDSCGSPTAS